MYSIYVCYYCPDVLVFYSVEVDFVWRTLNDWRFSLTKRWSRCSSACKDDIGLAENHTVFKMFRLFWVSCPDVGLCNCSNKTWASEETFVLTDWCSLNKCLILCFFFFLNEVTPLVSFTLCVWDFLLHFFNKSQINKRMVRPAHASYGFLWSLRNIESYLLTALINLVVSALKLSVETGVEI